MKTCQAAKHSHTLRSLAALGPRSPQFKCRLTILAAIMLPPFLHVFVIGPTALEAHCTLLHAHLDEIKSIESFESRYTSRWIPMNDVASHGGPGERTSFPVDSSPNCSPRNQ